MRTAVYTAVAGAYPIKRRNIQCFGEQGVFQRPVMEAKRYKILPHLFFPQHDVTIWIDGNITLKIDPDMAIEKYLGNADIAVFRHSYRDTVWQEFSALRSDHRMRDPFLQTQMAEQERAYRGEWLPTDTPLYECNFLIRRNVERVNRLMESWWAQICRWQWRDQVSFPYVMWKYGQDVAVNAIKANIREHPDFEYVRHY